MRGRKEINKHIQFWDKSEPSKTDALLTLKLVIDLLAGAPTRIFGGGRISDEGRGTGEMSYWEIAVITTLAAYATGGVYVFVAGLRKHQRTVYRKVMNRTRASDGDILTLECGHRYLLTHVERASFPCEDCKEMKRAK